MTCARKTLLSLALVILGLGFSSTAHAVFDAESFECRNFEALGTNLCSFNTDNTTIPVTEYYAYSGLYPDRTTVLTHQTGAFNFSSWNVTNYSSNFWFDFTTGGNHLYYQSNGLYSIGNGATSTTGITDIIQPLNETISSSTLVLFTYTYYNSGEDTDAFVWSGIDLIDSTGNSAVLTPEASISSIGTSFHIYQQTLITGHLYVWRPYLRTASSTKLYGAPSAFYVVSNPNPNPLSSDFATSTATSTSPLMFLNLVSLIQQKHPIAWIPQTISLVQSQATLTGTSSFPTLRFNFTDSRLGSTTLNLTTVDMFSTSTISYFFGATQIALFKTLITAVVWVGVVLFLIRDIRKTLLATRVN